MLAGQTPSVWGRIRDAAEKPTVGTLFSAGGTVLSGVAIALIRDPRPMLLVGWVFLALMCFEVSRVLFVNNWAKILGTTIGTCVTMVFCIWLYYFLAPQYVERPTYGPSPATYCYESATPSGEMQDRFKIFVKDVEQYAKKFEDCTKVVGIASILVFERATFIWMFAPKRGSYILYQNGEARFIPEDSYCEDRWCNYDTKEAIDKFEKILGRKPANLHTPYGQSSSYFAANPNEFKKIGWLKWACQISENSLLYQKLTDGFAAGIYPTTRMAGAEYQGDIVFVNENLKSWVSLGESGARAPSCS